MDGKLRLDGKNSIVGRNPFNTKDFVDEYVNQARQNIDSPRDQANRQSVGRFGRTKGFGFVEFEPGDVNSGSERGNLYDTSVSKIGAVALSAALEASRERSLPTPDTTFASTLYQFRADRLRGRTMRSYVRSLADNAVANELLAAFTQARKDVNYAKGNEQNGRANEYRVLSPLIVSLMNDASIREGFVETIDECATRESDGLKMRAREFGGLKVDVLIVGAGVQGSVAAARLRAENPELSILVVDNRQKLGGQFRSYGERPTFSINSRSHRPQDDAEVALPGSESNLNPFGAASILQLTDFVTETYPNNVDMGHTAAINTYFAAPAMLGVEMTSRSGSVFGAPEMTVLKDTVTGEEYTIQSKVSIGLTGAGERKVEEELENVWTAEKLLSHFGDKTNRFPMQIFKDKKIAIIGGGDTGRIAAELFARLAPKEAYGNSVVQLGGPELVAWYGVDFATREEYCEQNRSRYNRLSPFIANSNEKLGGARMIRPITERAMAIDAVDSGSIRVTSPSEAYRYYDIVIDARNLVKTSPLTAGVTPINAELSMFESIGMSTIAQRLAGTNAYIAGPAANINLTDGERAAFADGIKENAVALWANVPRVERLAQTVGAETSLQARTAIRPPIVVT